MVCTRNNVCICFALCKFNCRQGYLGTLPVLAGSVWLIWWRSIRGQQLLQAGKILWNLHSVQRQFSLAPGVGFAKGQGMFGATSWVLSEISGSMYASSHRARRMKTMWCSLCRNWKVKGSSTSHMKAVWWMASWSSVRLCFALQLRFGRLETMCGKPMLSPAVAAMRRSGRSHSGRLRVGRFARSMGSNGFWAGRARRCG